MGFFPYMGEILWVFLTFMEVFPIPPLSRGRPVLSEVEGSGGGWGIYVAVVIIGVRQNGENLTIAQQTTGRRREAFVNHPSHRFLQISLPSP